MDIQFSSDLLAEIQQQVSVGRYSSADEMLRAALDALRMQEEEVAAIQAGLDDVEAGRVLPLRQWDREFRQAHNIPLDQ